MVVGAVAEMGETGTTDQDKQEKHWVDQCLHRTSDMPTTSAVRQEQWGAELRSSHLVYLGGRFNDGGRQGGVNRQNAWQNVEISCLAVTNCFPNDLLRFQISRRLMNSYYQSTHMNLQRVDDKILPCRALGPTMRSATTAAPALVLKVRLFV